MKRTLLILLVLTLALPGFALAEGETRTVTDGYGRTVEIPTSIETIAATSYTARILAYAGVTDMLVGVTDMDKTGDVGMPYSALNAEFFNTLTSVGAGGSGDVTYYEALVMLNPDVIFCNKDAETADDIQEKTGIPVVGLNYSGIFDESVYDSLRLVGEVTGATERCEEVVSALQGWEADLYQRTKDIPDDERPTVYTGGVSYRGAHGFEGTYAQYPPFVAINARNVVDETEGNGALLIDLEKIVTWDPEIIFLNPANLYLVDEDYVKNPAFYDGLSAVQNGRVYAQVSYNYNSTNIELAVADAYYAGTVIYPEAFADVDPAQKADEIFTFMLGEPFYAQLQAAGQGFGQLTIGE